MTRAALLLLAAALAGCGGAADHWCADFTEDSRETARTLSGGWTPDCLTVPWPQCMRKPPAP